MTADATGTYPFLYGAQYYRAPTPDRVHWAEDLRRMADAGFNAVKFWAQWRWTHQEPEQFRFDDLDELMDLAGGAGLSVTVNVIFDVAPSWLFARYPDCKMITAQGRVLEPHAVSCRQLGGYPGPCFNHPAAWSARERFLRQTVARYLSHPALGMWDLWNEPESCLSLRRPDVTTLVCYCEHCRQEFVRWLMAKYQSLESLNQVWGRCYRGWSDLELPRDRGTFTDMVDWRLFHLDMLTAEARRRVTCAKAIDRRHPIYVHPVPNTMAEFNAITGADDFALAEFCDCFGGTINGLPSGPIQAVASAQGKVCYNVESHLRAGGTGTYPRSLSHQDFANAFIPQIGLGIRGFLHWQYRCETLGSEAPGWGLLDPDGQPGMTHAGAVQFWHRLRPVAYRLTRATTVPPQVAVFKSAANEIFRWCMDGELEGLQQAVDGFSRLLYEMNAAITYVDDRQVCRGLPDSLKLLILPGVYALDRPTAESLVRWVSQGGTLLCEGPTGAYDLTTGRYSSMIPGLGLAQAFSFAEINPVAVRHLGFATAGLPETAKIGGDLAKALKAFGHTGGQAFSIALTSGSQFSGRRHYAELDGEGLAALAGVAGHRPCVVCKKVGAGRVFYAASEIGWQWCFDRPVALRELVQRILIEADLADSDAETETGLRVDRLATPDGEALAVVNLSDRPLPLRPGPREALAGLFTDARLTADSGFACTMLAASADLFVPVRWLLEDPHSAEKTRDQGAEIKKNVRY